MKWSQGLCASILLDGFYSFSPRPRLDPRRGQDFPAAPVGPVFAPNGFAADWGLPPRLGAATPRASPQFTSELAIERQHYGLFGDLLAGVEEGDSAARERAVAVRNARRVLDLEFLRAREGVGKIQEPARADGVGRADLRRAAPHPIVIREAHRLAGHALITFVSTSNSAGPPPA